MANVKMVPVDPDKFKKWLAREGLTAVQVSLATGRNPTYISRALTAGQISMTQLQLMHQLYGLKVAEVVQKQNPPAAPKKTPPSNAGYSVEVQLTDITAHFLVYKDGKLLESAYAAILDSSEISIMQAISYAAHMCYKFNQQKVLAAKGGDPNA